VKILFSGDWHLKGANLALTDKVLGAIGDVAADNDIDYFVNGGDLLDEVTAETVKAATEWTAHISELCDANYLLIGNHDWDARESWPGAIFSAGFDCEVKDHPEVLRLGDCCLAFLPAPNRAAFGSSRGAEGKRSRDAALSAALEAAIINLETEISPENLKRAILFFHGTVAGCDTGTQVIPKGLTWEIPVERLSRWGLAIGSHIHRPQKIGENIYYAGGLIPLTFGETAEQYRALLIDTETMAVESIPLPRVLTQIEMELHPDGLHAGKTKGIPVSIEGLAEQISVTLARDCGVEAGDTVALKLRAILPQESIKALPIAEELEEKLRADMKWRLNCELRRLILTREATGTHRVRMQGEVQKMTLQELFDEWLSVCGNDITEDPVVDEARLALATLDQYAQLGGGKFGYKPISLKAHNFCQWTDAFIDYGDYAGSVSIIGQNKIGKSTLWVKGPTFALHKKTISGQGALKDELRNGTDEGFVEHAFEAGGRRFVVRRALERSGSGVSCKSELLEIAGGLCAPVCEKATDIDRKIEELVGSYEFVLSTFLGTQDDIYRLINATNADWGRLFLEALGLDRFESPRSVAADMAKSKQGELEASKVQQKVFADRLEESQALLLNLPDLAEVDKQIGAAEGVIEDTTSLLRARNETLNALKVEAGVIAEKLSTEKKLQADIHDLNGKLRAITAPQHPGEAPPAVEKPANIEDKKTEITAQLEARKGIEREENHITKRIAEIDGGLEGSRAAVKGLESGYEFTKRDIEKLQAELKALTNPPCWDIDLAVTASMGPDPDGSLKDRCPAWKAYSNGDHILELQNRNSQTALNIDACEASIKSMEAEREAKAGELENCGNNIVDITARIAELQKAVGEYENSVRAVEMYESLLATYQERCNRRHELASQAAKIEEELASFKELREQKAALSSKIEEAEAAVGAASKIIESQWEIQARHEKAKEKIGLINDDIAKAREKLLWLQQEHLELERSSMAWSLVERSLHTSGIPYFLMERMIGAFQQEANEILAPTGMNVQIETITPTKKGEARDKISITFSDERGEHPLQKASGYQVAVLGMALRAAMAIVGAKFYGNVPEIYVQDEGWGAFHEDNYDIARELIASIARRFRLFPYITHIARLADSADMKIRIVRDSSGNPVFKEAS
jgi:DNA repair exonuclease SbcCD nuclease subunit